MHRKRWASATVGLSLVLMTTAVAASALAAMPPRGGIVGKITMLTLTSVQVKTQSGNVTEKLTSSTVISRMTRGSLSDLKAGTFVNLTVSGKTVSAISVGSRFGGFRGRRPSGPRPARTFTPRRPTGRFSGGTVVGVGKGQLTVRSFQGKTATYTLSKSVAVTRTVRTTRSALHLGETVRVAVRPGSTTAFAVTILSG